ncbi:hypothetical protein [Pseudomonas sp. FW300-N2F2]|uniref:hypothetical protein n=1 Tax=Pseudomonas sp. FW300-N2F2 TaxID=2751320 RepID=UPI001A91EB8B|nr:hypothetical protein [Pseudomonas sp. FW300-N2F2]
MGNLLEDGEHCDGPKRSIASGISFTGEQFLENAQESDDLIAPSETIAPGSQKSPGVVAMLFT